MDHRTLLLLFLSMLSLDMQANALPTPFVAHYNAYIHGMPIGIATKTLKRAAPNQYNYSIEPKIEGIMKLIVADDITMHCQFNIQHDHIKPLYYMYSQAGGRVNKHIALNFTADGKQACDRGTGQCWKATNETLYDPLSVDFAYPIALKQGAKSCQYKIVTGDKDHIQKTRYKVVGEETIVVDAGSFKTLKVTITTTDKKQPATLWLAKDIQFFPVQIIQQRKKYTITFKLKDYQKQRSSPA